MKNKQLNHKKQERIIIIIISLYLLYLLYSIGPFSFDFWKIIFFVSFSYSLYLSKKLPEIAAYRGNFSQKDIILFSTILIYFIINIFYKTFTFFSQEYNSLLICNSTSCYQYSATLFILLASSMFLMPLLIGKLAQCLLAILSLSGLKSLTILKPLLYLDIITQKFYISKTFYIFKNHSNGLHEYLKRVEMTKKEDKLYNMNKENTNYLFESQQNNVFSLICYFFIANLILITLDILNNPSNANFKLSILSLVSIIIIIIATTKFFIFIFMFILRKELLLDIFQQKSRGNSIFFIIIISIFLLNSLLLSMTFIELFWILYLCSFLFDLILKTHDSKRTQ